MLCSLCGWGPCERPAPAAHLRHTGRDSTGTTCALHSHLQRTPPDRSSESVYGVQPGTAVYRAVY